MSETLEQVKKHAQENHVPIMMDSGIAFLLEYIDTHPEINRILEVGCAVGYSSMQMASLRKTIHIDTLEIDEKMVQQARFNIEQEGLSDQITVHHCDGAKFIAEGYYDLIFIDAAKAQYRNYLEHFYPNSKRGTIFVFDNLNFHGIVDDPSRSHNRSTLQMCDKIRKFRNWLLVEPRFQTTFYQEIGDGVAFAKRIRE